MNVGFKRKYIIEITGRGKKLAGTDKTALENSFERFLQNEVNTMQKILPFPSEKLTIRFKEVKYLPDLDK